MIYKPDLRERSKGIIRARNWGIRIIPIFVGLSFLASEYNRIKNILPDLMGYSYIAIFCLTGILIFLWIWATQRDFDLLFKWLDPKDYSTPSTLIETLLIVGNGLFLCILLYSARDPLLYGSLFTVYSLAVLISDKYARSHVEKGISKSRERIEIELKKDENKERILPYVDGIEILEDYYVKRPHIIRHITLMIFCCIGLGMAIYWKIRDASGYGVGAYMIYFISIFVSEIVIAYWRIQRDYKIGQHEAKLTEIIRMNNISKDAK